MSFNGWRNPLSRKCQIRRFGYKSLPLQANAAAYNANNLQQATVVASRFNHNTYRSSGVHQGVDLEADYGSNIYAVCTGKIVKIIPAYGSYGKTIILECNVDDLPMAKRALAKNSNLIYFVYAHLSSINVKVTDYIEDLNTVLGKTGNSGNAGNMTKIEEGAHLHFEVRTEISKSLGKSGLNYRLDPFPWLDNCITIQNGVNLKR